MYAFTEQSGVVTTRTETGVEYGGCKCSEPILTYLISIAKEKRIDSLSIRSSQQALPSHKCAQVHIRTKAIQLCCFLTCAIEMSALRGMKDKLC
jgi:hypothetical protein